jgi:hypothetical protein
MKLMMNHVISYGSTLSEVLTSKLTAFYNKVLLEESNRMIVLLPLGTELSRAELHKAMFDEIMVTQFDPTSTQFWNCKNIYKFLYFTHSSTNVSHHNIYIDYGKVFRDITFLDEADMFMARSLEDPDLIRYVNKMLNEHCDLPLLDDSEIAFYDFSLFYISDDARLPIQKLIQQTAKMYPEYVDILCSYAILSCLVAHAKQQNQYRVETMDEIPVDIANCGLVEDFYTLI